MNTIETRLPVPKFSRRKAVIGGTIAVLALANGVSFYAGQETQAREHDLQLGTPLAFPASENGNYTIAERLIPAKLKFASEKHGVRLSSIPNLGENVIVINPDKKQLYVPVFNQPVINLEHIEPRYLESRPIIGEVYGAPVYGDYFEVDDADGKKYTSSINIIQSDFRMIGNKGKDNQKKSGQWFAITDSKGNPINPETKKQDIDGKTFYVPYSENYGISFTPLSQTKQ